MASPGIFSVLADIGSDLLLGDEGEPGLIEEGIGGIGRFVGGLGEGLAKGEDFGQVVGRGLEGAFTPKEEKEIDERDKEVERKIKLAQAGIFEGADEPFKKRKKRKVKDLEEEIDDPREFYLTKKGNLRAKFRKKIKKIFNHKTPTRMSKEEKRFVRSNAEDVEDEIENILDIIDEKLPGIIDIEDEDFPFFDKIQIIAIQNLIDEFE